MATDENRSSLIRPTKPQGGGVGTRKFGRRALSAIDQNAMGAAKQTYPCAVNKRAITEECVIYDENIPNPVKRPITRKFAAQLKNAQQQQQRNCLAVRKKPDLPIQISNKIEACRITDVEDGPASMSPKKSTSVFSEKSQMEEVEMEDISEESVIDIDSYDAKNHLAVVEYVGDIYAYYRKMEAFSGVSPNYMSEQCDINEKMRSILIDWLIEVHYKFELREETLFLTVNLIDRFLARESVVRKKLQLVGLVAMLLACKYEEVLVPVVDDLIFISDKAYTRTELLEMEKLMLNTLQFNMSLPTPYVFLTRFLKAAESDEKLKLLSFFLAELTLVEHEMLRFPPSLLAAAAVYTAQSSLYGTHKWSKTCEFYSTYSEDNLLECARLMVGFHQSSATGKLTGVKRKYSTSKFEHAAKCDPALFLLEDDEAPAAADDDDQMNKTPKP